MGTDKRDREQQPDVDPGSYIGQEPERAADRIPGGVLPDDERVAANSSQSGVVGEPEPGDNRRGNPADGSEVREAGQDRSSA